MKLKQISELSKIAFNKTAQKYHDSFKNELDQKSYDKLLLDKFSNMLEPKSLVCDAGCGPSGHIGKYLHKKGHSIIGIDISPSCVDLAKSYNPEIDFKVMDIMNTSFENNFFDGIISFYSIIYTPKRFINKIFSEFNRILKIGGNLLVVVKKGTFEGIIDDNWYEGNKVYFSHFLEEEINTYFNDNNFEIDLLETRAPYEFEINVDRIYAIGTKITK